MKLTRKIIFIILTLAIAVTAFTVVALAAEPDSNTKKLTAAWEKDTVTESYKFIGSGGDDRFGYIYAMIADNGNKYVEYTPRDYVSENAAAYIDLTLDTTTTTKNDKKIYKYNPADYPYMVYDFDVMTPTGTYGGAMNSFTFRLYRYSGTKMTDTSASPLQVNFSAFSDFLDKTPYTWQHVTLVMKFAAALDESGKTTDVNYVIDAYINGKLVATTTNAAKESQQNYAIGYLPEELGFYSTRMSGVKAYAGTKVSTDDPGYVANDPTTHFKDHIAIDNNTISYYTANYGSSADIAAERFPADYELPYRYTVATVTDAEGKVTYYDDFEKAFAVADATNTLTLFEDRDGTYMIDKAFNLNKNGFTFNTESRTGYFETLNGEVTEFRKAPSPVRVVWDPACDGECDCYYKGVGHTITEESLYAEGVTPKFYGSLPEIKTVNGLMHEFIGWTYEKGGKTPMDITAVSSEAVNAGVLYIYPVYVLTQYSIEVINSDGTVSYYFENEYDSAIAAVAKGGNLTLHTDVTAQNGYTFTTAGANIVFDLNGHNFKRYNTYSVNYHAVYNEESESYSKGAAVTDDTATEAVTKTSGGTPQTFTINASNLSFTIKNTGGKSVNLYTYTLCSDAWLDADGIVRGRDNLRDSTKVGGDYSAGTVLFGYRAAKNTTIRIEGEGISYYGACIVDNEWGGNQNTNSIYIDGGSYHSVVNTHLAMISQLAGGTVDVRNADFIMNGNAFVRVADKVNTSIVTVADFTFANCNIVDAFNYNSNTTLGNSAIKLIDCRYYASGKSQLFTYGKGNSIGGTEATSPLIADGVVKLNHPESFEIPVTVEKSFVLDENGIPTFEFTKTSETYSFVYRTADIATECAEIYWIDGEGYVFDVSYALKNATLTLPSLRVPSGDGFRGVTNVTTWLDSDKNVSDLYIGSEDYYEFFPVLPEEEDREYAACMTSAMFNMVYFTNFAYNVYVPKAEGVEIVDLGGTVPTRTVWIKNVEYWVYTTYAPSTKALDDTEIGLDYIIEGVKYSVKFKPSAIFYAETIAYDPYAEDDELELIACLIRYIEESYKAHFGTLEEALAERVANFYEVCSPSPYAESYPDADLFNSAAFVDLLEDIYLMVESGKVKFVFTLTDEAVAAGYKVKAKGLTSALYTTDGKTFSSDNTPLRTHVMETFTVSIVDANGNTVKVDDGSGNMIDASSKYSLAAYVSGTGNTLAKALYAFGQALRAYYPVDPDNYQIDSITLFDEDISDYTIAADASDAEEYYVAEELQALIYSKSGYWLEIVPHSDIDKSIVINLRKKTGAEGFSVTFEKGRIELICEYEALIHREAMSFFSEKFAVIGDLSFNENDNFTKNIRDIFYSSYGAVGDGVTDDSEAIRAAHAEANKIGYTVCADPGAKYYIGPMTSHITIKTDVNWADAEFIIDDRNIAIEDGARTVRIFHVSSDVSQKTYTASTSATIVSINEAGGIDADTITRLDMGLGKAVMLQVFNDNHKNYIRYGANANSGAAQQEVILVDKDGNIDPSTPFMFDYEKVTKITVYDIDSTPITIDGGIFTTRANAAYNGTYSSYMRNIQISRPNTTVRNLTHYVTDEGEDGSPYEGFLKVHTAYNVTFENCTLTGHKIYKNSEGTGMGTYDISATSTINARWINCKQTNFFKDEAAETTTKNTHWGIMGSSYCKNLYFDNCRLTRFDAHAGIYNVDIRNSDIIHITVVGGGTLRVENTRVFNNSFIQLRTDYGNFWHGNIILKNNQMITTASSASLITGVWYNHDFGYPTALPENTVIDGLEIYTHSSKVASTATVNLYSGSSTSGLLYGSTQNMQDYFTTVDGDGNVTAVVGNTNQFPAPERVVIRNCDVDIVLPDKNSYPWFENTVFDVTEKGESVTICERHFDLDGDLLCDDCESVFTPCESHSDSNLNGSCGLCGAPVDIPCDSHIDKNMDQRCDTCHDSFICSGHVDQNSDHICDECGGAFGCVGEHTGDETCSVCKKKIPACDVCTDIDNDAKCDECDADILP